MVPKLRKNSKEVKELFKKDLKCEVVSDLTRYKPVEVDKSRVEGGLGLRGSAIVVGTEGKKYCVYSGNARYNITVLEA